MTSEVMDLPFTTVRAPRQTTSEVMDLTTARAPRQTTSEVMDLS